jgi:antitoxin component of MazEF toxin-antitoxin module
MEATVVEIGASLGFKVPDAVIRDCNLKAGAKVELNFIRNGEFVFRQKSKIREGWDAAFARYALDGEDEPLLPDFLDSEVDAIL